MVKSIGTSTVELGDPIEIRDRLEKLQEEFGDSLKEDQPLKPMKKVLFQTQAPEALLEFWQKQDTDAKRAFRSMFGRIDHLLTVQTPVSLLKAAIHYWDPAYRCFTFGSIDLSPLMEEYAELLGYTLHANKIYNPGEKTFAEAIISKLLSLPVKKIKEMGGIKGARWTFPEEILMNFAKNNFHNEEGRFAFAIAIYGAVIFPCAGGNIDRGVIKMVNHVKHQATPVPAILCETFRSLNHCRISTEGKFIGCAQLLGIWLISHLKYEKAIGAPLVQFQKDDYQLRDPIGDFERARLLPQKPSIEKWSCFLSSLDEKNVYMKAPWHKTDGLIYKCGDFDWVPLIGPWGIISQAPAMFLQQTGGNPCKAATYCLKEFEFSLEEEKAKTLVRKVVEAWSTPYGVRRGPRNIYGVTQYKAWHAKRGKSITLSDGEKRKEKRSNSIFQEKNEDGRVSKSDFIMDKNREISMERKVQEIKEDTSSDDEMIERPLGFSDKDAMWKTLQIMTNKYKKYKGKFKEIKFEFIKNKKMKIQEDMHREREKNELRREHTKMEQLVTNMKGELQEAHGEIIRMKKTIVSMEELSCQAKKEMFDKVIQLERNMVEINSLKKQMEYAFLDIQKFQRLYKEDEIFIQQKEAEIEELNQQNEFLHEELNELQQRQRNTEDKIKLIMSRALYLSDWAHSYEQQTQELRMDQTLKKQDMARVSLFLAKLHRDLCVLREKIFQTQSDNSNVIKIDE